MPPQKHSTNEWEFQGEVLKWLNAEIKKRPGLKLDKATQESPKEGARRNDLVVWWDRSSELAFLTFELKTPETSITTPSFLKDGCEKAQRWSAPFFAIWNMQSAELYKTPSHSKLATPADRLHNWPFDSLIKSVDDWLKEECSKSLQGRTLDILDYTLQEFFKTSSKETKIDATIFVNRLSNFLKIFKTILLKEVKSISKTDRHIRALLKKEAATQGLIGTVDDYEDSITAQYAYRIVGQILFYYALRRKQPHLKPLTILRSEIIPEALRPFWDDVRRFDYEALFEPSNLDKLIPLPNAAQMHIRKLITDLSCYDWNSLKDDVLGAVFENLIPTEEQHLFGQFYTPSRVSDILIAFTVDGSKPFILDPGCGSGTFLLRSYDFFKNNSHLSHQDILNQIWGFDISSFAAQLSAINLYRQDMAEFDNFPHIVCGDFFKLFFGHEVPFPPSRGGEQEKVLVPIPKFDAIIGNPPYLRSQNQDDLDPSYKIKLFEAAALVGANVKTKTDLFAFFIYKSLNFMKPKSRIGFVTSSSWLTSDFGFSIQKLLSDKLKLVAIISSSAESFFEKVDVNTILFVAEKRDRERIENDEKLKFINLKRPIRELFPDSINYWRNLTNFADHIEQSDSSFENDDIRVKIVDAKSEFNQLLMKGKDRNWSLYLRAPLSYYAVFGEGL